MPEKKGRGFQESLRNTFIRYALIPVLALVLLWGVAVLSYTFVVVRRTTKQTAGQTWALLADEYAAYTEFFNGLKADGDFLAIVDGGHPNSRQQVELNQQMYSFMNSRSLPGIFYLFNAEKDLIATNTWENRANFLQENPAMNHVLDWIDAEPDRPYHRTRHTEYTGGRKTGYTLAQGLYQNGKPCGYLVFDLLEEGFSHLVTSEQVNYAVVTDHYENTIAASDASLPDSIGRFRPAVDRYGRMDIGGNSFFVVRQAGNIPFQVFTLTSLAFQKQLILFGLLFIGLSAALLLLVMVRLSGRVARRSAAHLEELVEAVGQLQQGNLHYNIPAAQDRFDEFEYLTGQYRRLVEEISTLLDTNQKLADMTRTTEIKQLQAQFNPHFIFNVLETLKYEVHEDAEKSEQIISLLAKLLRYSISTGEAGGLVTLGHDMGYIENYLTLQKIRYDERLQFSIHMPRRLHLCKLPKLIIQPLVENCIVHGYNKKENLAITIAGTLEKGDIILRVTDDGDGMDAPRLERVRSHLQNRDDNVDSIGLYNAHRRLQLLYGGKYGVTVFSMEGMGTEVVVTFPDRRGGPDV